jgi:hypothetical protein
MSPAWNAMSNFYVRTLFFCLMAVLIFNGEAEWLAGNQEILSLLWVIFDN